MGSALLIWPRLRTLRFIIASLQLWVLALCLPLLLLLVPLFDAKDLLKNVAMPDYMKGLIVAVVAALMGQFLQMLLMRRRLWAFCNDVLVGAVQREQLLVQGTAMANQLPARLRGDRGGWDATFLDLEASRTAAGWQADPRVRANDCAQRLSPLFVLPAMLVAIELFAPWGWSWLRLQSGMQGVELTFALTMIWLIWGTFLGCCLSLAVAPWIRAGD